MPTGHDLPFGILAETSGLNGAAQAGAADPLSDVLRTVRLRGAVFFIVDVTSPWCDAVPRARDFAGIILPGARHIVSYHVVVEGRGFASLAGAEPIALEPGDIIVFPHGDAYSMSSAPGVPPGFDHDQTLQFFRDLAAGRLPFVIPEGGGEAPGAKIICGFLGCDLHPFNPLFATLPRALHIRRPDRRHVDLLDRLIELTIAEAQTWRAGGESIRLRLSELMFVELLRRHLEALPPDEPGWLAGLRDPHVGRVLALLHGDPAREWTLAALARAAGTSRSVLAERFARAVGETPMRYLKLWRMQIAARRLTEGGAKVSTVGEQVGFRSEAAFSRTFKDATGLSPSAWRRSMQTPR